MAIRHEQRHKVKTVRSLLLPTVFISVSTRESSPVSGAWSKPDTKNKGSSLGAIEETGGDLETHQHFWNKRPFAMRQNLFLSFPKTDMSKLSIAIAWIYIKHIKHLVSFFQPNKVQYFQDDLQFIYQLHKCWNLSDAYLSRLTNLKCLQLWSQESELWTTVLGRQMG